MAIGAISLGKRTCVMLGAIQSPNFRTLEAEKNMSMLGWYKKESLVDTNGITL